MPSVSGNGVSDVSLDASEPIRQAVALIQAKIRTLEGQKNAVNRRAEVDHLLEFANELLSHFSQLQVHALHVTENRAMLQQVERHERDLQVAREILVISDVLSGMGDEVIRTDFLRGHHGALLLAESDLECLDKLYKMVTPSREAEEGGASYRQQLAEAAEHMVSLVDSCSAEVLGTTYRELKKLILAIHNCGYFNNDGLVPAAVPKIGQQAHSNDVFQFGFVNHTNTDGGGAAVVSADGVATEQQDDVDDDDGAALSEDFKKGTYPEDNTVFSTFAPSRPIADLIAGSEDICNFLQESQIELDASHFDPAVVAVHPMVPSSVLHFPGPQHAEAIHYPVSGPVNESPVTNGPNPMMAVSQINQFIHPSQMSPHSAPIEFHQGISSPVFTNQTYADLQTFAAAVYGQMPPQPFIPTVDQPSVAQVPKKHLMNVNAAAFESLSCKQQQHTSSGVRLEEPEIPKSSNSSPHNTVVVGASSLEQDLSSLSTQDPQDSISSGYSTQSSQQSGGFTNKSGYNSSSNSWGSKDGPMRPSGGRGGSSNGYGGRGGRQNNNNNSYFNNRGSGNYHGYRNYYTRDSAADGGTSNSYGYKRGGGSYGGGNRGGTGMGGLNRGSARGGFGKPASSPP